MNLTIKSKNGDINDLSERLNSLSKIIKTHNILPISMSLNEGTIFKDLGILRVRIKYLELAELAKGKDIEVYDMSKSQQLVLRLNGIEFYCNRKKKPLIRRIDPQNLTNESWSLR